LVSTFFGGVFSFEWRRGGGGFDCDVLAVRLADEQISYLLTQRLFLQQPLVIIVVVVVVFVAFVVVIVEAKCRGALGDRTMSAVRSFLAIITTEVRPGASFLRLSGLAVEPFSGPTNHIILPPLAHDMVL